MIAPDAVYKAGFLGAALGLCLSLVLFLPGCSPVTRHRVLTVFFDGVPPLEEGGTAKTEEAIPPGSEPGTPPGAEAQGPKPVSVATGPEETGGISGSVPGRVQHPPYAMKMCDGCHETAASATGAPIGFSLLEERNKLCATCHEEMSQEELAKQYAWVHGPVQFGACTECHHPHESANAFMLKAWPIQELCFQCHDRERILAADQHLEIGDMDCTECHNPHGSEARYFL